MYYGTSLEDWNKRSVEYKCFYFGESAYWVLDEHMGWAMAEKTC